MISCTTTTDSSRSYFGVHDDTNSHGAAFFHRFKFVTLFLVFLTVISSVPAVASYDRNSHPGSSYLGAKQDLKDSLPAKSYSETGIASWYGRSFHGKRTSSGERYDMHAMTAAHKFLPMNTMLKVRNLENGKEAIVRVNDRGPFSGKRILDLSQSAAKSLKLARKGTAKVEITILPKPGQPLTREFPAEPDVDQLQDEFYVQIAAFTQEQNAKRMQQRFVKSGHTTIVKQTSGKKSTVYRVLVAAGNNRDQAQVTERTMKKNGYKGAFVVVR